MTARHQLKEYPVRYSLIATERRVIAENLKRRGGATPSEIRTLAKRKNVAQKVILQLLETLNLDVLPETSPPKGTKTAGSGKRDRAFCRKPSLSPQEAAERLFKTPASTPPPPQDTPPQNLDCLVDLEKQLTAEHAAALEKLRRDHDSALQSLQVMEEEMHAAKAAAASERQRAVDAIAQTKALRKSTAEDRDRLEVLSGDHTALRLQHTRMENSFTWLKDELAQSIWRERQLLKALSISEKDLLACRQQRK